MDPPQSMFSEAHAFTISGGEFNMAGRDMMRTNVIPSSRVANLPYSLNENMTSHTLPQNSSGSSEVNHVSRDQVNLTVFNVHPNTYTGNSSNITPPNLQTYFGFPMFDIHEMEGDDADERPTTSSSTTTSSSSNSSNRYGFGFTPSHDSNGRLMSSTSVATAMTSLQDLSQSSLSACYTTNECSSSCELYMRLLVRKGQGYPLWSPTPSITLPVAYRETGVNIGDVGLITFDGAFDFLFNAFLPRNHPINPDDLWEDFEPMPFFNERDIDHRPQFDERCCLSSGGIHPAFTEGANDTHSFQYAEKEGAVLVFPDGAWSIDARNKNAFAQYAATNSEKWYQYANGPRARQTQNNTLYFVTGCVKAKSWGIAVVESSPNRTPHPLCLRSQSVGYHWRPAGRASARAYPKPNHPVYQGGTDADADALNQCAFIRGYRIALQDETWAKLFSPTLAQVEEEKDEKGESEKDASEPKNEKKKRSWVSKLLKKNRKDEESKHIMQQAFPERRDENVSRAVLVVDEGLRQVADAWYPSHAINKSLLQACPSGKVALTHDDDWCNLVAQQSDFNPLDSQQMWNEVQRTNSVKCVNGVIYLEPVTLSKHRDPEFEQRNASLRSKQGMVHHKQLALDFTHTNATMNLFFAQ